MSRPKRDHFDAIVFGPPTLLGVVLVCVGLGVLGAVDGMARAVRGWR